jgi:hypothetical protein
MWYRIVTGDDKVKPSAMMGKGLPHVAYGQVGAVIAPLCLNSGPLDRAGRKIRAGDLEAVHRKRQDLGSDAARNI